MLSDQQAIAAVPLLIGFKYENENLSLDKSRFSEQD